MYSTNIQSNTSLSYSASPWPYSREIFIADNLNNVKIIYLPVQWLPVPELELPNPVASVFLLGKPLEGTFQVTVY